MLFVWQHCTPHSITYYYNSSTCHKLNDVLHASVHLQQHDCVGSGVCMLQHHKQHMLLLGLCVGIITTNHVIVVTDGP